MLTLIATFYTGVVLAQVAPAPFQNSDITRVLEDGTVQKFDGNLYKIVPRTPKKKMDLTPGTVTVTKNIETPSVNKNRVTIYGGVGPSEIGVSRIDAQTLRVSIENRALLGVGYSRSVTKDISLDIIGLNNDTVLGGIGLGF